METEKLIRIGGSGFPVESAVATLEAALALSVATGRAFTWEGFRGRSREATGLRETETNVIRFFGAMCGATIAGGEIGGTELRFEPGSMKSGSIRVEVEGREPLLRLVRAAALPLGLAAVGSELTAIGSTHAPDSETFEVSSSTWVHLMRRVGLDVELRLERAAFAPKGGGEVHLKLRGRADALAPLQLGAKGELEALHIVSAAASLPSHVQQRQAARARSGVAIAGIDSAVQLIKLPAGSGSGSSVAITGVFGGTPITVSAVAERGRSAESVGEKAASELRRLVRGLGVLPEALLPSLLLVAAFARGGSRLSTPRLPEMVKSHAELVRAFKGREVVIDGKPGQPGEVRVEGEVASASAQATY